MGDERGGARVFDPEIEFHRFFNSGELTEKERQRHPGKLDLDKIDPNLARHLTTIKALINEMLTRNSPMIQTRFGPANLHLDYIDKPQPPLIRFPNAVSFRYSGFDFVGLTYDLVDLMNFICGSLARHFATASLLGIKADSPDQRDNLLAVLFLIQIQFAIDHELGHHFHGHTAGNSETEFFSEYLCSDSCDDGEHLEDQAREVEADGYAVHMMAKNLFANGGNDCFRILGFTTLSSDEFLVRLLLLCITSYFALRPQKPFDSDSVRNPRHPFGTMRVHVVMTDFQGWASEFKPEVGRYITQQTLDEISLAISAATESERQLVGNLELEAAFVSTDRGLKYRDDLYETREGVRDRMKSRAWKLLPDMP